MNHLQVVSGWLQLGRPDRAFDYIESVSQDMEHNSLLLRLPNHDLVAHLLLCCSRAEAAGQEISLEIGYEGPRAGQAWPPGFGYLAWDRRAIEDMFGWAITAAAAPGGGRKIAVHLECSERDLTLGLYLPGADFAAVREVAAGYDGPEQKKARFKIRTDGVLGVMAVFPLENTNRG